MKTIKDKGFEYQVGAIYQFSNAGKRWYVDVLEDIQQGSAHPYVSYQNVYKLIRACGVSLGAVDEAPVELIDGECYQYTDQLGNERKGFFVAENDRLYCHAGVIVDPSKCSNIKLLVVGE